MSSLPGKSVAIGASECDHRIRIDRSPPTTYGVGEVGEMFVDNMARSAAGTAATQAARAAESAGKICGGPFQFANVDRDLALQKLESLSWSR